MTNRRNSPWKFASCDGCQLSLLNCEQGTAVRGASSRDRVLPSRPPAPRSTVPRSEPGRGIDHHRARCRADRAGPCDVQVAGHDRACATSGGIQVLRNFADVEQFTAAVYAHPEYISTLDRSTLIAAHVTVDFQLRGCPIDRGQLLEVVSVRAGTPRIPTYSVCVECKRRGAVCVAVAHGAPCLGPVTPGRMRCAVPGVQPGCYRVLRTAGLNTASLAQRLLDGGMRPVEVQRFFRTFNAGAEAFRAESPTP